jgi:hypothetical protein
MQGLILPAVVVAVLALIVLVSAVHIVQQYERAVVFRSGRVTGEKRPGLVAVVPFINVVRKESFRDPLLVPANRGSSQDGATFGQWPCESRRGAYGTGCGMTRLGLWRTCAVRGLAGDAEAGA